MQVNLLVGGPKEFLPIEKMKQQTGVWLTADRGTLRLIDLGIIPQLAVGDFDSATDAEFQLIKNQVKQIISSSSIKDETDTELLLDNVQKLYPQAEVINIYGATGGRLDHFLSNLYLVVQPKYRKLVNKIKLWDQENYLSFFTPGHYQITKQQDKDYLAFVNLTSVKGLSLYDEKYLLNNADYDYPVSLASNEFVGQTASFSFDEGILCVVQSKDSVDNKVKRYGI